MKTVKNVVILKDSTLLNGYVMVKTFTLNSGASGALPMRPAKNIEGMFPLAPDKAPLMADI